MIINHKLKDAPNCITRVIMFVLKEQLNDYFMSRVQKEKIFKQKNIIYDLNGEPLEFWAINPHLRSNFYDNKTGSFKQ